MVSTNLKAVQAKVVSSISNMQPRVRPVALALLNQLDDQHNQDQDQIGKRHQETPTTQQPLPEIVTPSFEVLDSSAVLSIDKEEYYVDSSNVVGTEEFEIEENEFTLDTFFTTDCSPSKQPRLMNTESRQRTVDCPLETSLPPSTESITDHDASDTAVQVKASSLTLSFTCLNLASIFSRS